MTANTITDHPLTRRQVLEHIRCIRRTLKRANTTLGMTGEDLDYVRGRVREQIEAAIRRCDDAKLSLTKARPRRIRVR